LSFGEDVIEAGMKALQPSLDLEPQLKQAVEEAQLDLKTNRLFVSEDKARAWMRSLGTNQQAPRPVADVFIPQDRF
jgi:hypothetical protein